MCILCAEFQKEILTANQVSKLFSELLISEDTKHLDEYQKIVDNLSEGYKQQLNKEANEEFNDEFNDPFDPW